MQDWQSTCLGRRTLPRDLSAFEIEVLFNFSEGNRSRICLPDTPDILHRPGTRYSNLKALRNANGS